MVSTQYVLLFYTQLQNNQHSSKSWCPRIWFRGKTSNRNTLSNNNMPGHHLNKLFEQRNERVRQQSVYRPTG